MNLIEIQGNLFTAKSDSYFAQCISADFACGKGIAVEFNKRFNIKNILTANYPNYLSLWQHVPYCGTCIYANHVFNLITKERYYHKPTYESIKNALIQMKALISQEHITEIVMPKIGCGLDKLDWAIVRNIIKEVFNDFDITIYVYYF